MIPIKRSLRLLPAAAIAAAALFPAADFARADDAFMLDPYTSDRLVKLSGSWRFSIGDDLAWAQPDFDDAHWTKVDAPSEWEDEGYRNYDGFAWYRKSFKFPGNKSGTQTFIALGEIDDSDQVFLNGKLIGSSGSMPPGYTTAYSVKRYYLIPSGTLRPGEENTVAVRVYDGGQDGGIRHGPLGIYTTELPPILVDLHGSWRFRVGDDLAWAQPDANLSEFTTLSAPLAWEEQGHANYDGFAWYRKEFTFDSESPESGNMVLLLGKIDDIDEVYLNGEKIGGTGDFSEPDSPANNQSYGQQRSYYFPASKLKRTNTLAVRVYDSHQRGGIYEGPLGIVTQDAYIAYWEQRRKKDHIFNDIRRLFD